MVPRPRTALLAAFACLGGLVAAWIATYSPRGRLADEAALQGFMGLRRPRVLPLADTIAHLSDPAPFALCAAAVVAVALLRGRWRLAVVVPVVLVGANVTTQVLKPLLPDDRTSTALSAGANVLPGSWPSGHATASMVLALAAVMVVPPRLRPAAAVAGVAFSVAVSYSLLALGWHFPSDVLAGYSVAALWAALGVAALSAAAERWPVRTRPAAPLRGPDALMPIALAGIGSAAVGALLFLARPEGVVLYARMHTTFVVGALAIAGLGAALAMGLALVLRR